MAAVAISLVVLVGSMLGVGLAALSPSVAGAATHHAAVRAARVAARTAKIEARAAAKATAASTSTSTSAGAAKSTSGAQFEVCNVAGASNLDGVSFPFIEGNWSGSFFTSYALAAEPSPGTCGPKHSTTPGSMILVEEAASPAAPVPGYAPSFKVSNGTLDGVMSSLDFVAVTVNSGLTVLTVTNVPQPPAQTGTLELCKYGSDNYVQGSFQFNITAPGFSSTQEVPTGQCNDVTVPATNVTVSEPTAFPYALASVASIPQAALVSSDLNTQSAVVAVSPGGTSTVTFTNSTITAYAKVCKTLDRSQDNVLAGHTFTYTPTATFDGQAISGLPSTVSVTATPYGSTTCTFLANKKGNPIPLPLGTLVTFTEDQSQYPTIQSVDTTVSPANLNAGSSTTESAMYVGNLPSPNNVGNLGGGSVTQATFTNEAFGYVEICKTSTSIEKGIPFSFTVSGLGAVAPVEVGYCSPGYVLPVGTVTITEGARAHVTLTKVSSSIAGGATLSGNTATVQVPYDADNAVTFNNEINTGSFKLCMAQTSPDANLENTAFTVGYSYSVNGGSPLTGSDSLEPGQCSLPVTGVPVLNQDASTPVDISVTQQTTSVADVDLTAVTIVPSSTTVSVPALPHLLSSPGGGSPATAVISSLEGTTNVTFTNGRTAS